MTSSIGPCGTRRGPLPTADGGIWTEQRAETMSMALVFLGRSVLSRDGECESVVYGAVSFGAV